MKFFGGLILALLVTGSVLANEVVVKLKLSPTGQFEAKTEKVAGQVRVINGEVQANSIAVDLSTLKTGIKLRDDHMKDKYLNVKQHPNAILHLGKGKDGKGQGELEVKWIKKKIQGSYQVQGNQVVAEFPIKLSEYEISGIRYMGVGVKDEAIVKVRMAVSK